jgi:hypothetical protein
MNSVIFMPHCGGGGNIAELPSVLLTCVIVGVILIILGILANILNVKFSKGFGYTPIRWGDIKPTFENSILGCLGGLLGFAFICTALLMGLVVGIYWFIITL